MIWTSTVFDTCAPRPMKNTALGFTSAFADVCLFISTIFREHVLSGYGYPASRRALSLRRSLDDYEQEGRRYYGLAEEHPAAGAMDLSEVFGLLRDHFIAAQKPLSFIATHYLHSRQKPDIRCAGGIEGPSELKTKRAAREFGQPSVCCISVWDRFKLPESKQSERVPSTPSVEHRGLPLPYRVSR